LGILPLTHILRIVRGVMLKAMAMAEVWYPSLCLWAWSPVLLCCGISKHWN